MTLYNLVRCNTSTLGTGSVVVSSAVSGYKDFSGIPTGTIVHYGLRDITSGVVLNSEVGSGTWTSATNTLSRDTVYSSTNGGNKISLATGTAEVYLTALAEDFTSSGDVSDSGIVVGQLVQGVTDSKHITAAKIIGPAANLLTILNAAPSTLSLDIANGKILIFEATNTHTFTIGADLSASEGIGTYTFTFNSESGFIFPYSTILTFPINSAGALTNNGVGGLSWNANPVGTGTAGQVVKWGVAGNTLVDALIVPNITAGKTLTLTAVDNYTLTIPATGTAALLGTANVFTTQQMVDGTNNQIQLRIQGHSTQTANLQTWETSAGATPLSIAPLGYILGTYAFSSHVSGNIYGIDMATEYRTPGSSVNAGAGAGNFNHILNDFAGFSPTGGSHFGFSAGLQINALQAGKNFNSNTISGFRVRSYAGNIAGTVGALYGMIMDIWGINGATATGTVTNLYGLQISSPIKNSGTITNVYGFQVGDITIGSSVNAAFLSGKGIVQHGDQVIITGWQDLNQLKVTGHTTQTLPVAYLIDNTAATNTVRNVLQLETQSTGTAANGLGAGLLFSIETATASTIQPSSRVRSYTIDATNATRKYGTIISAFDTAERDGIDVRANGTTADIVLLGDTWFVGSGTGLPFGSCWGNEVNQTISGAVQNTWNTVSDTDMSDGQLNLVTHDGSGKLTVSIAGKYLVNWSLVLETNTSSKHIEGGISVSGTVANDGQAHYESAIVPNLETCISSVAILSLAANATVELAVRTTDTGTPDILVDDVNLAITQIGA